MKDEKSALQRKNAHLEKENFSFKTQLSDQLIFASKLTAEKSQLSQHAENDYQQLIEQI